MAEKDLKNIIPVQINSPALVTLSVCFYTDKMDFSGAFDKIEFNDTAQEFRRGFNAAEVYNYTNLSILGPEYKNSHKLELNGIRILRSANGLGFITFSFHYTDAVGEFLDVLKDVSVGVYNLHTKYALALLKPILDKIFDKLGGGHLWFFPPCTGASKTVAYDKSAQEECYKWINAISMSEGLFHICYSIMDDDFEISQMDDDLGMNYNSGGPQDHAVTYRDAFNRIVAESSLNSSKAYRDDSILLQGDLMSFYSPLGCGIYRKSVEQKSSLWLDAFLAMLAGIEASSAVLYDMRVLSEPESDARVHMGFSGTTRRFRAVMYKRSAHDSIVLNRKKDELPLLQQSNDRINRLYAHYLQSLDFATMVDTVNVRFDRCQFDYDNSKKDSMEFVSILIGIFAILSAFKDGSDFTNTVVNNIVHYFNPESQFNLETNFLWYTVLAVACIASLIMSIHWIRKNRRSSEIDKIKVDELKSIL